MSINSDCKKKIPYSDVTTFDPLDVRLLRMVITGILTDWLLPVDDVISGAIILFDTVVVIVTLVSALGTWKIHKQLSWQHGSLINLMIQQSM